MSKKAKGDKRNSRNAKDIYVKRAKKESAKRRVVEYRVRKVHAKGVTVKAGSIRTKSRNPNWIAWRIKQANPGFQTAMYRPATVANPVRQRQA